MKPLMHKILSHIRFLNKDFGFKMAMIYKYVGHYVETRVLLSRFEVLLIHMIRESPQ